MDTSKSATLSPDPLRLSRADVLKDIERSRVARGFPPTGRTCPRLSAAEIKKRVERLNEQEGELLRDLV